MSGVGPVRPESRDSTTRGCIWAETVGSSRDKAALRNDKLGQALEYSRSSPRISGLTPGALFFYVGTFRIKYPPTRMKIRSGDQAASAGGNWLRSPMASKRRDTTV